jgi:hypothetical protein
LAVPRKQVPVAKGAKAAGTSGVGLLNTPQVGCRVRIGRHAGAHAAATWAGLGPQGRRSRAARSHCPSAFQVQQVRIESSALWRWSLPVQPIPATRRGVGADFTWMRSAALRIQRSALNAPRAPLHCMGVVLADHRMVCIAKSVPACSAIVSARLARGRRVGLHLDAQRGV